MCQYLPKLFRVGSLWSYQADPAQNFITKRFQISLWFLTDWALPLARTCGSEGCFLQITQKTLSLANFWQKVILLYYQHHEMDLSRNFQNDLSTDIGITAPETVFFLHFSHVQLWKFSSEKPLHRIQWKLAYLFLRV